MDAYGADVLRYCKRMVDDHELAADLRQVVFIEAYRGLNRFAGRASLRTWLLGIARHRCLDACRRRQRRVRREQVVTAVRPTQVASGVRGVELQQALRNCLSKLGTGVRSAVLLRHQDGLSFTEIARVADQQAKTVEARVRRATVQLRRCLAHHGVDDDLE